MGKCKQGEAECGFDICCLECENKSTCDYPCNSTEITTCDYYEATDVVTLEQKVPETIKNLTELLQRKKIIEESEKKIRETLLNVMEEYNIKSFENDDIKMTYIAPTERKSIDSTKLKKEHPEIAEAYQKISPVKASVKIELR